MGYSSVDYESAKKSTEEDWMQYSNRRVKECLPFYLAPFTEQQSNAAIFALSALSYHGDLEHGIPRCRDDNGLRLLFIILVFIRNKIAITPQRFIKLYRMTHERGEKILWNKSKNMVDLANTLSQSVAPDHDAKLNIDPPMSCNCEKERKIKKSGKQSHFDWYYTGDS